MTLLEVRDLRKSFPAQRRGFFGGAGDVKAVDGVSFTIAPGETLGLVGESGCGKSTVGKLILRLLAPDSGEVRLGDDDIATLSGGEMRARRRDVQMIFQDPYASLNPRLRAEQIVGEPLANFGLAGGAERARRVAELFERVGLSEEHRRKFPHEFSGGQRQRLGIARALALNPKLIICDEPVSALDVSIQAQIINLMRDLQAELGLAYLFISHDLAVVEHISHRVAVMYLGRIVELTDTQTLFARPRHPYTQALLASVPSLDRRGALRTSDVVGEVPSASNPPRGCHFHPRCPQAMERCGQVSPALVHAAAGHDVACHLHPAMTSFSAASRDPQASRGGG